jgi:hypothetical protein
MAFVGADEAETSPRGDRLAAVHFSLGQRCAWLVVNRNPVQHQPAAAEIQKAILISASPKS